MDDDDLFQGFGVEVQLLPKTKEYDELLDDEKEKFKDAFLKIRETLTRIGIASKKNKTLYQSCHILHKRGRYAICHFKELFGLDGKPHNFSDEDKQRRNKIVSLLDEWGLLKVIDKDQIEDQAPLNHIKILHWEEKSDWTLIAKYDIGGKKK